MRSPQISVLGVHVVTCIYKVRLPFVELHVYVGRSYYTRELYVWYHLQNEAQECWKFPVVIFNPAYINVAYNLATMKMNGAVPANDCTSTEQIE